MGFGSGGLWIAITFAALERWPGQEYVCMSRIFATYSVGGLLGPSLGALDGIAALFTDYLALTGLGFAAVSLLGEPPRRGPFASDRGALSSPGFWVASCGILFAVLALGIVEGVLPLHLGRHLSQPEIGALCIVASASAGARRPAPAASAPARVDRADRRGARNVGASKHVPLWVLALIVTAVGIGSRTPDRSASWSRTSSQVGSSLRWWSGSARRWRGPRCARAARSSASSRAR